ncbi:MAG: hypothetical protein ACLGHO_02060 [Gammaproteobacteria bacterium]
MDAPKIQTAIPQRRYQLGEYQAVLLGEIESGDGRRYQYILALVRNGESAPRCFVTAERAPRARRAEGSHVLRLVTEAFVEELGASDAWGELDAFVAEALMLAARTLGIEAEPVPL